MLDFSSLFVSAALAADAAAPVAAQVPAVDEGSGLVRFLPLFLIFLVFYLLLIRPQQKQLEKQTQMLKALKKGDKIVTGGGFVGTIVKEDGDAYLVVEIAKDVHVKVLRSAVTGLAEEVNKKAETK